jgi:hypothetical protein
MKLKIDIQEAIKSVFLAIFSAHKSKFSIDDYIAKNHHEIGYRDYFNQFLASKIISAEKLRIYNLLILKFAVAGLITLILAIYFFSNNHKNLWQFSLIIFIALVFLSNHLNQGFVNIYQHNFNDNFYKFFGEDFSFKISGSNLFVRYHDFLVLPKYNYLLSKSSNLITGKIKNNFFSIQEIELFDKNIIQKKNPKFKANDLAQMHKRGIPEFIETEKQTKIGEGLVAMIDFKFIFDSKTILKQTGFRAVNDQNPDTINLGKILTENLDFNKKFICYSNISIELNRLLSKGFIEKFSALQNILKNSKIYAGVDKNSLLIFFETSEKLFKPSPVYQQLNLVNESKKIITLFSSIFELCDSIEEIYNDKK